MKEITELDQKYLVLKWQDIHNELSPRQRELLASMIRTCNLKRERQNKYAVLNLDDEFSMPHLNAKIQDIITIRMHHEMFANTKNLPLKIKDIVIVLVNAIKKAKEQK